MQECFGASICRLKPVGNPRNQNPVHPSRKDRRGLSPPIRMYDQQPRGLSNLPPVLLNQRVPGPRQCVFERIADSIGLFRPETGIKALGVEIVMGDAVSGGLKAAARRFRYRVTEAVRTGMGDQGEYDQFALRVSRADRRIRLAERTWEYRRPAPCREQGGSLLGVPPVSWTVTDWSTLACRGRSFRSRRVRDIQEPSGDGRDSTSLR